jgi:hypothetical protein
VCAGPEVIDVLEAPSLFQAERIAAMKHPTQQTVCRLWSGLTAAQRTRARELLPECRLIPATEGR